MALLDPLDPSILVNCLTRVNVKPIDTMKSQEIRSELSINCYAQAVLLKIIGDKLESKSKRTAIIDISSSIGMQESYTVPFLAAFQSLRHFYNQGEDLSGQWKNIDFMSVLPFVTSKGSLGKPKINALVADVQESAEGIIRCIGRTKVCYGSSKHVIYSMIMDSIYCIMPVFVGEYIRNYIRDSFIHIRTD